MTPLPGVACSVSAHENRAFDRIINDESGFAALPNGLRNASQGLKSLFSSGSTSGQTIINVRDTLMRDGWVQRLSNNKGGYLFQSPLGEHVRIMLRDGGRDIRIRNQFGNYLDRFGNVAPPVNAHEIPVLPR